MSCGATEGKKKKKKTDFIFHFFFFLFSSLEAGCDFYFPARAIPNQRERKRERGKSPLFSLVTPVACSVRRFARVTGTNFLPFSLLSLSFHTSPKSRSCIFRKRMRKAAVAQSTVKTDGLEFYTKNLNRKFNIHVFFPKCYISLIDIPVGPCQYFSSARYNRSFIPLLIPGKIR